MRLRGGRMIGGHTRFGEAIDEATIKSFQWPSLIPGSVFSEMNDGQKTALVAKPPIAQSMLAGSDFGWGIVAKLAHVKPPLSHEARVELTQAACIGLEVDPDVANRVIEVVVNNQEGRAQA